MDAAAPQPSIEAPDGEIDVAELVGSVPESGVLVRGQAVSIGWPEPSELDRITELRNAPKTLPWFLDRRPLDAKANREFLTQGVDKPFESILSIRWSEDDSFLGSIGWMKWKPEERHVCLGRLMVDPHAVLAVGSRFPEGYPGVAVDASRALGRFVVLVMKVRYVSYCYLENNPRAQRVAESGGLTVLERKVETLPDGRRLVTLETRIA